MIQIEQIRNYFPAAIRENSIFGNTLQTKILTRLSAWKELG